MFGFRPNSKKDKKIEEKVETLNQKNDGSTLDTSLKRNVAELKKLFADNDTFILRMISNTHNSACHYCIAYFDGVVNSTMMNDNIIRPLMLSKVDDPAEDLTETLLSQVLMVNDAKKTKEYNEIIKAITYGDTVLLIDGIGEAILMSTKGFQLRAVNEPDNEKILSGPREGFTESIMMNLSLIRRKVRTSELKMKFRSFGVRTNTQTCICYIDSLANRQILKELERRLDKINIDGLLDSNYITELTKDSPYSPFRTTGYTERPDVVIAKLLEGRIAVFVDGSPVVLTIPYLFIENFQSNEDYYLNFFYTSFSRVMRIFSFFLTVTIPGFYIATVAFHHEMLPTPLMINIAMERQSVPLPASLECFIMLIAFELLRETGIRMPSNVGQALSIVGALVIGQAAVEAKLVASPMIIVVALSGITSLLVPKMNAPIIYVRFALLMLSSFLGFFGLILGLGVLLTHILSLSSFGIPTISASGYLQYQEIKDTAIRAPWWQMLKRPQKIAQDDVRMKAPTKEDETDGD